MFDYWLILEVGLVFFLPFMFILISMPYLIKQFSKKRELLVRDYYKPGEKLIPTGGGLIIMVTALLSISLNSLLYKFDTITFVTLNVIMLFGLFGILDDMINIGRPAKLLLMYYCSYPLIQYAVHSTLFIPFLGNVEMGIFYSQLIVPTFVLVVTNLVNMHSGFNGMSSGMSLIILFSLIIKSLMNGSINSIIAIIAITGATSAFYLFERYPARIFWGNIGSLTVGSAIGTLIVIQGYLISGFVMLIPHTANFLMYVYWRIKKYPQVKFGKVREDGTIEAPNPLTLKWVLPYYRRLTEKQATYAMFALTGVFSALGILIPNI